MYQLEQKGEATGTFSSKTVAPQAPKGDSKCDALCANGLRNMGLRGLGSSRPMGDPGGLPVVGRKMGDPVLPLYLEGLWELVAQLVEQRTFNAWVLGSNPSELTTPQAANPFSQQLPIASKASVSTSLAE